MSLSIHKKNCFYYREQNKYVKICLFKWDEIVIITVIISPE